MRAAVLAAAVVAFLMPVHGLAQQASQSGGAGGDAGTLELKRQEAPPARVHPAPESETVDQAERSVNELERRRREERLLRETTPAPPRRPDLDYDVKSGIQQQEIEKALPE